MRCQRKFCFLCLILFLFLESGFAAPDPWLKTNRAVFDAAKSIVAITQKNGGDAAVISLLEKAVAVGVLVLGGSKQVAEEGDRAASSTIESFRKAEQKYPQEKELIIVEEGTSRVIQSREAGAAVSGSKSQAENRNILKTLKAAIVSHYSQAMADSISELEPLALLRAKPLTGETLRKIFKKLDTDGRSEQSEKQLPPLRLKGGGAAASIPIDPEAELRFSEALALVDTAKERALGTARDAFDQWCALERMQDAAISSLEQQRNVLWAPPFRDAGLDIRQEVLRIGLEFVEARKEAEENLCDHPVVLQFFTRSEKAYQLAEDRIRAMTRNPNIDPLDVLRTVKIARQAFLNTTAFIQWNKRLTATQRTAERFDSQVRRLNRSSLDSVVLEAVRATQSTWELFFQQAQQAREGAQEAQNYWDSHLITPPLTPRDHEG